MELIFKSINDRGRPFCAVIIHILLNITITMPPQRHDKRLCEWQFRDPFNPSKEHIDHDKYDSTMIEKTYTANISSEPIKKQV